MEPIRPEQVQEALERFVAQDCYLHLETTNGAYAAQGRDGVRLPAVGVYFRNGRVRFTRAVLTGPGPYRIGLHVDQGWVYAEGLTDWEMDREGRLLLAGHDHEGRLAVALELSSTPFKV